MEASVHSNASSGVLHGRKISVVKQEELRSLFRYDKRRNMMMIVMFLAELVAGIQYSIIGPFFPTKASN